MKSTKAFAPQTLAGFAALAIGFSSTAAIAAPSHRQIVTQGPNGASKLVKVAMASQPQAARQLSPFNLAYMAYQGWFTNEGIPSANQLLRNYRTGRISALEVAQAAVKTNRLSADTLQDESYLARLGTQLNALSQD
ncbi:hypothetical protein [Acaryochloris sp. IP29b_bin.148]|uniref:hypothetical protein n=1 Tax=Acaryochloris sp. IP29b_bin.148 TaxID=2969218 RepID=UPI002608988F|nr:hypothetical protein [Acaryochloris sp. IP29b_bin.148]